MSFEPRDERPASRARPAHHVVVLRHPLPWTASSSPFGDAAARDGADGLAGLRLFDAAGAAREHHGLGVARHGGWPYHGAPARRLSTVIRFVTLWLFHNEGFARESAEGDILAAVRGDDELPPLADPELVAWWKTARRYRAAMGPAWCVRFADRFADWLVSLRAEVRLTAALRATGAWPSFADYMPVRMVHVGVQPALDLLEYACDCPLPLQVRTHPAADAVRRYAGRLVAIQGDLTTVERDLADAPADQLPNLVGCLLHAEGATSEAALAEIEALHDESLCGLTGAAQWLRAEFPRCGNLARWLRGVQSLCHGFARWHLGHGRHARPQVLPDGSLVSLEIEYV